jgi:hypothetical protein
MDERGNRNSGWSRLKVFAGLVVVAFAVTLGVVVGNRLSDEALAVLAGAVCGVGAAIPTSLLIVAVSRRRDEPRTQPSMQQGAYSHPLTPPVVVVAPQGRQQWPNDWNALPPSLAAPSQREFKVVGGSAADTEGLSYERYS